MLSPLRYIRSSVKIIRKEGFGKFFLLLKGWLSGKRSQYHPDESAPPVLYDDYWRQAALTGEEIQRQREMSLELAWQPFFLILTPATQYETFYHSIVSVLHQTYPWWVWMVAVQPSHPDYVRFATLAKEYPRIWLVETLDEFPSDVADKLKSAHNRGYVDHALYGVSAKVNDDNLPEHPDYVLFLEEGDQLALEALFMLAEAVKWTNAAILYSDYDYLDPARHYVDPVFKPDWSPELMLSFNLLRHLGCYRWDVWKQSGPQIDTTDFALKASHFCVTGNYPVKHIPRVLYHRLYLHRKADFLPDTAAVVDHLERSGLRGISAALDAHNAMNVTWSLSQVRKVSVIIPSKDQPALLERCLSSLFSITDYPDYQVIVVDTGSVEPETFALYDRYLDKPRLKRVDYSGEFNFSRACNVGAQQSDGELLLFLNNDTEILHEDWLRLMVQWFEVPEVGIVGAKLLYPDGKIQHAGVVIGLHGLAAHVFALMDEHTMTMFGSDDWYRNYMAVTGACLMIPRSIFDTIGGFEEDYKLNYSDVELCIAVYQAGYRIVYTPQVRLSHHESATHRGEIPIQDTMLYIHRWRDVVYSGDPYYNPNLTVEWQIPDLRRHEHDTPYHRSQHMVTALGRKQNAQKSR